MICGYTVLIHLWDSDSPKCQLVAWYNFCLWKYRMRLHIVHTFCFSQTERWFMCGCILKRVCVCFSLCRREPCIQAGVSFPCLPSLSFYNHTHTLQRMSWHVRPMALLSWLATLHNDGSGAVVVKLEQGRMCVQADVCKFARVCVFAWQYSQ